jgi:hypothetical protein
LKNRYIPRMSIKLNRISVMPEIINNEYMGANISRKRARTGYLKFNFLAVRKVNKAAPRPSIVLKIFTPMNPIWAKGAISVVNNGFPQGSRKNSGCLNAYLEN